MTYIGKKYGMLSNALAIVGLASYSMTFEVVDETERCVALRALESSDHSLSWLLKRDLSATLEEIKG